MCLEGGGYIRERAEAFPAGFFTNCLDWGCRVPLQITLTGAKFVVTAFVLGHGELGAALVGPNQVADVRRRCGLELLLPGPAEPSALEPLGPTDAQVVISKILSSGSADPSKIADPCWTPGC